MTHYCFSTKWPVLPHPNRMNSVIVPYPFEALAWYRHWGLKRMHFRTYWAQFLLLTALNQAQTRAQYRHMQVKWCCKPISSRREKALLDPFIPSMRILKPESCAAGDLLLFGTPRVSQPEWNIRTHHQLESSQNLARGLPNTCSHDTFFQLRCPISPS